MKHFSFLFCLTNSIAEMNFSFFSHFFSKFIFDKIVLLFLLCFCVVMGRFSGSKNILEKDERYVFPSLGKSNKNRFFLPDFSSVEESKNLEREKIFGVFER